jgi:sialic acid synthase SpsE
MSVFIIAEAGANHNRDIKQAFKLVTAAKKANTDAVKFQTYSSETLYAKGVPDFAGYKNINKLIKDIELPREWQKDIKMFCDDSGIEFMSTPFDEKAVEELYNLGVKRIKIAGFESTDPRFVKMVASTGLPLIITSGIASSVRKIVDILGWVLEVNHNPDVTILHGNNAYPTPLRDANVGQIKRILEFQKCGSYFPYQFKVGLSDHTEGILVPPLAVAVGATTIEKHFTLSRSLDGPDHKFAIEPEELIAMAKNVRSATECLGERNSVFTDSEKSFISATRSLVAKRDIHPGELLTEANVTTMRPHLEGSVPAAKFYQTINQVSKSKISKNNIILERHIDND